jgi:hypothetical protein
MPEHNDRNERAPNRRAAEGVRIIGAEEAQRALDAGQAAGRRADDERPATPAPLPFARIERSRRRSEAAGRPDQSGSDLDEGYPPGRGAGPPSRHRPG